MHTLTCHHCQIEFEAKTWNRKYCSKECRAAGRTKTKQAHAQAPIERGTVRAGLEHALTKADHLTDSDQAAVAAARALADKIDQWDVIVQWAKLDAQETGSRPAVPMNDGNSLAVYLKYCEALGLTTLARNKIKPDQEPEVKGGKLAQLRAIQSA